MVGHEVPNIVLVQDHDDANTVVAGVLTLKGCQVRKTTTLESCLSAINELENKVDVVFLQEEIALSNNSMILKNIKKINPSTMILVMTNDSKGDSKLYEQQQQIDGFVQMPISAENLADKILMLISKKELKRIKESQLTSD